MARGANPDDNNNANLTGRVLATRSSHGIGLSFGANLDPFETIQADNIDLLSSMLQSDPEIVNQTNIFGRTLLQEAASLRRTNIVDLLDAKGARWDAASAARMGRLKPLREILARDPGVLTNRSGPFATLLHLAAFNGRQEVCQLLLDAGASLNEPEPSECSPLGLALMAQQAEVAAFLRRRGATENIFDAVQAGHIEQIKTLLTANPDAARATNALKRSVLAPAADLGDVNIVELLLDHGAPVNGQPGDEDSPLLAAMSGNRTNIVRLLVERGADVNATGASGLAPLHNAAIYGSTDVAQFLIEDKADINVRVSSGNRPQPFGPPLGATPLHLAVLVGETNMIDLLLKSGADVNAVNRSGQTPLDAIMSGGRGGQWPRMGLRRNRPRQDVPGGHSSFNRQAAMALLEAAGGKHSSQLPRQYPGQ